VITYWFMALYCAAKTAAFVAAVTAGAGWGVAILHAWTEADQALVGRGAEFLVPGARVRPGAVVIAVPQSAIDLAKRFEGFQSVPKRDPEIAAIPTSVRQDSGRLVTATSVRRITRRSRRTRPKPIWHKTS
jgi:hypothetical protein